MAANANLEIPAAAPVDSDFLHRLLHDLKGPVGRARMLSELIERRGAGLDPETKTLLGYIGASVNAAETVLDAVRRYAEVLDWPFRPSRFDLTVSVDSAVARLEDEITGAGATINRGTLPAVWADMAQMTALFVELISNALRFRSLEPPVIEIAAIPAVDRPESTGCLITVIDNGIGISDALRQRLFQPLSKATERAGAGMGLAICRYIAEVHRGEIVAAPRAHGAEFRVKLPGQ